MTLTFQLTEDDSIAFTEEYLRNSSSHQKLRKSTRWALPIIMLAFLLLTGIDALAITIFGIASVMWFFLYPRRFDANVRKQARKQMSESSYSKSYGDYRLSIEEFGLRSSSPLGESTYAWDGVDRVEMTGDYLYIFLAGPMGYPILISQIGEGNASKAFSLVSEYLEENKTN